MFCPNCRDEFREGFTTCQKCGVDLIEDLPALKTEEQNADNKLLAFKIEDYLKYGGIAFIIVTVVKTVLSGLVTLQLNNAEGLAFLNQLAVMLYTLLKDVIWGLFYIGLAQIISILKKDVRHG